MSCVCTTARNTHHPLDGFQSKLLAFFSCVCMSLYLTYTNIYLNRQKTVRFYDTTCGKFHSFIFLSKSDIFRFSERTKLKNKQIFKLKFHTQNNIICNNYGEVNVKSTCVFKYYTNSRK